MANRDSTHTATSTNAMLGPEEERRDSQKNLYFLTAFLMSKERVNDNLLLKNVFGKSRPQTQVRFTRHFHFPLGCRKPWKNQPSCVVALAFAVKLVE
jgi:hypothetical protein